MKICILGAGALGCTIGAALVESGQDVWLINRNKAHVWAMQTSGLVITDASGTRRVPVRAAQDCIGLDPVELVVVLVKSLHTFTAIRSAQPVIGPQTLVLTLQNGLGHGSILEKVVNRNQLLMGKTYVGGALLADGHVRSSISGKPTIIGEPNGSLSPRVQAVAEVFNAAGLTTSVSTDIDSVIWEKLLINVATGAVSALTRLDYGHLYSVPELRATALRAVAETMQVAQAAGARLETTEPAEVWHKAADGLPHSFKASMLQSIENGAVTEVDYINGAVVDRGRKFGVPTPVNHTLLACLKGVEHRLASGFNQ